MSLIANDESNRWPIKFVDKQRANVSSALTCRKPARRYKKIRQQEEVDLITAHAHDRPKLLISYNENLMYSPNIQISRMNTLHKKDK